MPARYLTKAVCRLRLKGDGTRAETRFRLSPKRTSPFKSAGASVQSTAGSRGEHISFSNAGYTTVRGTVWVLATHSIRQFPLHFPPVRHCVRSGIKRTIPSSLHRCISPKVLSPHPVDHGWKWTVEMRINALGAKVFGEHWFASRGEHNPQSVLRERQAWCVSCVCSVVLYLKTSRCVPMGVGPESNEECDGNLCVT